MRKTQTKPSQPKHGELKVWWIPQVPGKPFEVPVKDAASARLILSTLADYDLFQLAERIKPDFANAGGLQVYNANHKEWQDWYDQEGRDFDQIPDDELAAAVWEALEAK